MSDRIRSRHGNVIAADFRPRGHTDLRVNFVRETLYCDGLVVLNRTTAMLGGKPLATIHTLADLATGRITQLNHKDTP